MLVGVCMVAVSAQASAAPLMLSTRQALIERVSFGDLDLLGDAGKATLQRRIRAAARRLCNTPGVLPLAAKVSEVRCNRTAIARASAQFDRIAAARGAKAVEIAALALNAGR